VRNVIHVAAVYGEPGEGYRQIVDVGRCVTNALAEAEQLGSDELPVRTILFPLLGVGTGGGELDATVTEMVGAAIDHLAGTLDTRLATVWLLASTEDELAVCRHVLDADPRLRAV
jgi:O-acetyl-ADP-ribose deacetylase (regulator of RNase III)